MATKAVLFDLDGTLADSLADIATSTNACLHAMDLPTHPPSAYPGFVGHGIRVLVQRALAPLGAAAREQELLATLRIHYSAHSTDHTVPYPGIVDLLAALRSRGLKLAVVSNKPDDMTQCIVQTLFPDAGFGFVTGECEAAPRKPDPTGILLACRTLGVQPEDALYVGDTPVDVQAAAAAGLRCVAVSWGFRDRTTLEAAGPDHLVDRADAILDCL
ncbi:MAG: HAD-IA family hydrolase [Myxococcota bacterium]